MPTYSPKASEITHAWHVVDAEGLVLGRVATEVARVLRGKHKPIFAPHMDTGDFVIIVNADKVVLTSSKFDSKLVRHHTGYPGGLKTRTYGQVLAARPEDAIRRTIKGKQITAFEWVNSGSVIAIETVGSTTITSNGDGTYTLVQKGSGFWLDDGNLSGTAEFVRFTGTVRSIGLYDAKEYRFQPLSRTIDGVTAPMCEMLVTGLKTRH